MTSDLLHRFAPLFRQNLSGSGLTRHLLAIATAVAFAFFAAPTNPSFVEDDICHHARLATIQEIHQGQRLAPVPRPTLLLRSARQAVVYAEAVFTSNAPEPRSFGPVASRAPPQAA